MSITHIKEMQQASLWATQIIFDTLPAEYLDEPVNSSFSTIKATLLHCWSAQVIWYNRIMGNTAVDLPVKNEEGRYEGRFADLKEGILSSQQLYIDLLEDKTDDFLNQPLNYTTTNGDAHTQPIYQILLQLSHHNAFHRGQIVAFMRQLGFTDAIPQTDLIAWYRENG